MAYSFKTKGKLLARILQFSYSFSGDDEIASIASSEYTFDSVERPDLDLLVTANNEYSKVTTTPFSLSPDDNPDDIMNRSGRSVIFSKAIENPNSRDQAQSRSGTKSGARLKFSPINRYTSIESKRSTIASTSRGASSQQYYNSDLEIMNDETEDEGFDDNFSNLSSLDPTFMVLPNSVKAHSGVARYKDFVRLLPVHISKLVLAFLDRVSLNNCVCVSKNWRILAEEVHRECFVQHALREEVMLMQVCGTIFQFVQMTRFASDNKMPVAFRYVTFQNVTLRLISSLYDNFLFPSLL